MGVYAIAQNKPVDLTKATIVYNDADAPLVKHMAQVMADDIERVSGNRPAISTRKVNGPGIMIGTVT